MPELLKMDIFFTVATVGFIVLGILAAIFLIYAIQLVRTVNRIALVVEEEAQAIKEDIDEAREKVAEGVNGLMSMLLQTLMAGKRLLGHKKKRRSS